MQEPSIGKLIIEDILSTHKNFSVKNKSLSYENFS